MSGGEDIWEHLHKPALSCLNMILVLMGDMTISPIITQIHAPALRATLALPDGTTTCTCMAAALTQWL